MIAMGIFSALAVIFSLYLVLEDLSPLTTALFFSVVLVVAMHYIPGAFA